MKKIIGMLATYASLAILTTSLASVTELKAQTTAPAPAAAQGECSAENKLAWYNEFREKFKTDQPKAYELAQKYLACPTAAGEESIATYLKEKFVAPIDKARRTPKVSALIYEQKDYPKAFELGKQVLADEPENLRVLIDLGYGGYAASTAKNDSFSAESLGYARKAIQAIESGKAPESWVPYKSKEDTLAYLYNAVGQFTLKTNVSEALAHLIKAAQFQSELKKDPWTYFFIAAAYEAGPYTKLSADYKARFEGKDESPESKLALENINQVVDRMVDAYARAVSLSGTDAKFAAKKTEWMESLSTWYKYRNKDDVTGLPAMIASVMSKPLPPEPTPITTLPTPTPTTTTTTPASGTVSGSGNGAAPGTAAKTTATTTEANAVKPKPKNNHSTLTTKRGN